MQAHLRRFRISPKKLNIIAGLIRRKSATEALDMLKFIPNKGAAPLFKALTSAVANAKHNDGENADNLVVDRVIVNKAQALRRFIPSSRGRALPLRKPMAHVSIYLKKAE